MKKKLFRLALLTALVCALLIVGASATSEPTKPKGSGTETDPYQIGTAEELYWFAGLVNGDTDIIGDDALQNTAADAVLTADIDLNGDENNMWTPIGGKWVGGDTQYTDYTGTFDGQGHTISGLYVDSQALAGLFGSINKGGEVKNLNIANGNVSADSDDYANVGGVCGQNYGGTIANCSFSGTVHDVIETTYVGGICGLNLGDITNCYNTGSVSAEGTNTAAAGGVCGNNYSGTITNCYSTGTVSGNSTGTCVGGVCGINDKGRVTNCYSTGAVSGTGTYVGGVCGVNKATITNCYWLDTAYSGIGGGTGTSDKVEPKTEAEFASGEVAWLLSNGQPDGPWRQNLNAPVDKYPVLDSSHHTVSKVDDTYTNDEHNFDNGFCSCGAYQPATQGADGVYQIANAGQLYWFAAQVNGGETDIDAVLMNDIEIQTGVLDDNGELNGTPQYLWTPIGSYTGTFEGQNHTISGLYVNISSSDYVYAGLFGYISGGTVKNLSIADSYISGSASGDSSVYAYVSGVCGYNDGGRIENCSNSDTVTGSATGESAYAYVGGVCGANEATITNCCNSGSVTSSVTGSVKSVAYVGGVCGYNTVIESVSTITNCYNTGIVSGTSSSYAYVGGVCGYNDATIGNCYNTGDVSGTGNSNRISSAFGGVCGINDRGMVTNCYSTGAVSGTSNYEIYVGGVCGYNNFGPITNCYWLKGTTSTGIGTGSGEATEKTAKQFASGEVAWLLNKYETGSVWAVGDNGYPVLRPGQENKVVKLTVDNIARYLNSGDKFEGEDGKVYYGADGNSVSMPYRVTADTTLTSKTLVTPSITGTASKVYDGTTSGPDGLSITLSGIGDGDTVTATATFTYDDADVGINKTITATGITLEGDDAAKYALSTDTVTTDVGEITPRPLTITAEDKSANMGDAMPTLTYRYDGLVGGESLLKAPELTCDPDMTKAGEYPITVSGGSAGENYTIVHVDGKLVVGVSYVVTVDGEVYYVHTDVGSFELPAAPSKPGYIFMGWRSGDTTYGANEEVDITSDTSFTAVWANMPDIEPDEPDEPETLPFTDVPEDAWYYDAVCYVWENGIIEGVETDKFAPNSPLTRAMVWAILARLDGVEVSGDDWMTTAQAWAISSGVSDGKNATGYITREQLVTMLWRYAGSPVVNYALTAPDASEISDWAIEAMRWAASIGLIEGDENGNLNPTANSTRAHAAAFMQRFCK